MSTSKKRSKLRTLYKKLDKTAKVLMFIAIIAIILPFFASGRFSILGTNVSLPANTRYEKNFTADGHIKSSSTGKSITYYPYNNVFPSTYIIKNGNELWTEYGKVAKINERLNGNIYIYNCSTSYVKDAIGGTWKRSN